MLTKKHVKDKLKTKNLGWNINKLCAIAVKKGGNER